MIGTFQKMIASARGGVRARLAVPLPIKQDLDLLCRVTEEGFILPVLIGDGGAMESLVKKSPLSSLEHEIVNVGEDPGEALSTAITLVREGRADILMQGGIGQKPFMEEVLDAKNGLLKSKVASYASIVQFQRREKLVLVTDTFINNFPGIAEKQIILENVLGLAGILGMEEPKVAVISAIEQVNPSIPSTLDAAALAKMAERGQFGKAVVDGPLDMDCALSRVAAARKNVRSVVTGNADIYLVPEIETGLPLVQALCFFGGMKTAGMMLGAKVPVIPDIPFISDEERAAELALAVLMTRKGGNHE